MLSVTVANMVARKPGPKQARCCTLNTTMPTVRVTVLARHWKAKYTQAASENKLAML